MAGGKGEFTEQRALNDILPNPVIVKRRAVYFSKNVPQGKRQKAVGYRSAADVDVAVFEIGRT